MAEEDKKLSESFAAAAATEGLLRELELYYQRLQKLSAGGGTRGELAALGEGVTEKCIKIVENQLRQNARMDELEERLARMEGNGTVWLDKPAKKLPEPKA